MCLLLLTLLACRPVTLTVSALALTTLCAIILVAAIIEAGIALTVARPALATQLLPEVIGAVLTPHLVLAVGGRHDVDGLVLVQHTATVVAADLLELVGGHSVLVGVMVLGRPAVSILHADFFCFSSRGAAANRIDYPPEHN